MCFPGAIYIIDGSGRERGHLGACVWKDVSWMVALIPLSFAKLNLVWLTSVRAFHSSLVWSQRPIAKMLPRLVADGNDSASAIRISVHPG